MVLATMTSFLLHVPLQNSCTLEEIVDHVCLFQFDCYVSQYIPPSVYPVWDSELPGLCWLLFSHVWEIFSYYLFKYFLKSSLSLPSGPL